MLVAVMISRTRQWKDGKGKVNQDIFSFFVNLLVRQPTVVFALQLYVV